MSEIIKESHRQSTNLSNQNFKNRIVILLVTSLLFLGTTLGYIAVQINLGTVEQTTIPILLPLAGLLSTLLVMVMILAFKIENRLIFLLKSEEQTLSLLEERDHQ